MNIGQKTHLKADASRKVLCIIVATGEERYLIPVYDSNITTGLNAIESKLKLGKFCAWKDPNTDEYFKPKSEAYPKPQEPFESQCSLGPRHQRCAYRRASDDQSQKSTH